jgi:hypothetical protein
VKRTYGYAATTKLKGNAADGLFTKPSVLALIVYLMEGKAVISDIRERERGLIPPESILESLYKTVCK